MIHPIAINARYLNRPITGVERYAREISARLEPPLRLIAPEAAQEAHRGAYGSRITGHFWEQVILPRKLSQAELLWSPANSGPWMVKRQVITLHDASPFDHPEWYRPAYAAWIRISWRILVKMCAAIITVSEFSRSRLMKHLRINADKITVISYGVGKPFQPVPRRQVGEINNKFDLNRPYFFFVGSFDPRKNLNQLLHAWEQLSLPDTDLVIAGIQSFVTRKSINPHLPGSTKYLGYINSTDMAGLYTGAIATIVPSQYEGFCLPVLESMACGTPVITSGQTAITEIANGASWNVNPVDIRSMTDAILQLIENHELADRLRCSGLERASKFTWENSVGKIQAVFRSI